MNFSAQGNTLASEEVVKAMAAAYQNGKGTMAERLMDALDAGQSKGGDTRGMQSAGILVMRPLPPNSDSTVERIVDIRVDDAENPFKELRRLLNMTMGVPARLTTRANELAKEGRHADAIVELKKALEINPRAENVMFALAQRYAQSGQPNGGDGDARARHQAPAAHLEEPGGRGSRLREPAHRCRPSGSSSSSVDSVANRAATDRPGTSQLYPA